MKRIFSLVFCLVLVLGSTACGGNGGDTDTSGTKNETEISTRTSDRNSTATDTPSSTEEPAETAFDDTAEHKFLATDIKNHAIVVFDLNRCDGDLSKVSTRNALVWVWDADNDPNCKIKPGSGIDAAKYRYSPYYKKDVIIACSSNGWAGVIDYEEGTVLWEYNVGDGPHSIELMPDSGDIVVACSGNGNTEGKLAYVPLSAGVTAPVSVVPSPASHGVSWDPENKGLWVLEYDEIRFFRVDGEGTATAALRCEDEKTVSIKDNGGHVLSPVLGEPGNYWISASKLWKFDSAAGTVSNDFSADYLAYNQKDIKGMASFADGTFVQTVARSGGNTTYDWSCGALRIGVLKKTDSGTLRPSITEVVFKNREFYKVFPFTKEYQ